MQRWLGFTVVLWSAKLTTAFLSHRYFQKLAESLAFSIECRSSTLMFSQEVRTHNPTVCWLHVPEHIQFWLCVLAYHCVHGTTSAYLADSLQLTADAPACRRVCSTDSHLSDYWHSVMRAHNASAPPTTLATGMPHWFTGRCPKILCHT